MIKSSGFLYVPIRLRIFPIFKAVFPPIAASTIPNNVVGITMCAMPLIYDEATNPHISVTVPPPIDMMAEFLLQ